MKKRQLCALFLALLMLAGCSQESASASEGGSNEVSLNVENKTDSSTTTQQATAAITQEASDYFSNRDFEVGYDESSSAIITLKGDSAECSSNAVKIEGSTVTITDEGTYILSGTLNNGMIIVNTEKTDKTQLVLNGVNITSESSAAIYVLQSDKVFITTADGTENTLTNGGTFTAIDENNIDAVIFSKEDLTLNGSGTLTISSPAGHGIVSKDSLTITSGSYNISSASHGLAGKDDVCIANADFVLATGKDGIHAENNDDETAGYVYIQSGSFDISAEGDGISAAAYMLIEDGTFNIVSGGGSENAAQQTSENWGMMGGMMGGGRGQKGDKFSQNTMTDPNAQQNGTQTQPTMPSETNPQGNSQTNPSQTNPSQTNPSATMPENGMQGGTMTKTASVTTAMSALTTTDAEDDSTSIKGIKAGGELIINGGDFTIDSADDAVHSNSSVTVNGGTFSIESGDDGFHADETLTINDCVIDIKESYEGLEGLHVLVNGGEISLVASDDGLNAAGGTDSSGMGGMRGGDMFGGSGNGSIEISGGKLYIQVSGDGIDANGTLSISGGYTVVCGPTQGDTAVLDYDKSATISGGTFIGTGATSMAQSFSSAEQGLIAVNASNQSAGTEVKLCDSNGNVILSVTPELSYGLIILSSPEIVSGQTYSLTVGSQTESVTAK